MNSQSSPNSSPRGETHRIRNSLVGLAAVGVLGASAYVIYETATDREQVDPTIAELFHEANQECANEKVAAVSVTPEQIAQADSLSALTKQINSDVKSAIAACVFERTEIPEGTEGFVIQYPTLELSLDASAVAVTEGN